MKETISGCLEVFGRMLLRKGLVTALDAHVSVNLEDPKSPGQQMQVSIYDPKKYQLVVR